MESVNEQSEGLAGNASADPAQERRGDQQTNPARAQEPTRQAIAIVFALLSAGCLAFLAVAITDGPTRVFVGAAIIVIAGTVADVQLRPGRRALSPASLVLFAFTTVLLAALAFGVLVRSIADVPNLLLAAAVVVLIATGALAYRLTRMHGVRGFRETMREHSIVIACLAILATVAGMVSVAADLATPQGSNFRASLLQGLSASFIEDVVFFSLLGFILVLLQRRDADRSRNLDDKIELLFSAKTLRSGEAAYLREEVRKISADCKEITTVIDVTEFDDVNELLLMDVSRRFYVGNYLSTESARYSLSINLTPDAVPGHQVCMEVFPTIANSVNWVGGEWQRAGDDEVLDGGAQLQGGQPYRPPEQHLDIRPGQVREFRTRFRGWQPIYKPAPAGSPATDEAVRELDGYEVLMLKHWDQIEVHVRNSLNRQLTVAISGRERREIKLLPGDEQRKAYRIENLSANSNINISFTPA